MSAQTSHDETQSYADVTPEIPHTVTTDEDGRKQPEQLWKTDRKCGSECGCQPPVNAEDVDERNKRREKCAEQKQSDSDPSAQRRGGGKGLVIRSTRCLHLHGEKATPLERHLPVATSLESEDGQLDARAAGSARAVSLPGIPVAAADCCRERAVTDISAAA